MSNPLPKALITAYAPTTDVIRAHLYICESYKTMNQKQQRYLVCGFRGLLMCPELYRNWSLLDNQHS